MDNISGIVFDLKRFAVHDGEGIRSTLFLKGCPLGCRWCQNPESISPRSAVWYSPSDCIGCGLCVKACPENNLFYKDGRVHAFSVERLHTVSQNEHTELQNDQAFLPIDKVGNVSCSLCGTCVEECPAAARRIIGEEISPEEAARRLLRDRVFFGKDGGVTISGGEVLMQWQFAAAVLRICKEQGVDTAIETCLFAKREALDALIPLVDHFIVDIKVFDPELHRQYTGADNRVILSNFEYLVQKDADLLVRTPLIPGFTATDENITGIADYLLRVKPDVRYELLNFNPLCRSKYAALEKDYPVIGNVLSGEEMDHFYEILAHVGITNIVKES